MDSFEQQLHRVNAKLQQLIKQHQTLQKENDRLKQELSQVKAGYESLVIQSEQLEQQAQILKMSKNEMSESDKKAFEKRLTQYVREIDRCIALLNQ